MISSLVLGFRPAVMPQQPLDPGLSARRLISRPARLWRRDRRRGTRASPDFLAVTTERRTRRRRRPHTPGRTTRCKSSARWSAACPTRPRPQPLLPSGWQAPTLFLLLLLRSREEGRTVE